MKYFFTLLLYFTLLSATYSQCSGIITLYSQAEVDSFKINYPNCSNVGFLTIDDLKGDIFNLDSLDGIKRAFLIDIQRIDSLESILGLNNLEYVLDIDFIQKRYYPPFAKLDTIRKLTHRFLDTSLTLNIYQNVKHIEQNIWLHYDGKFTGLSSFTSGKNFKISCYQNKLLKNSLKSIIPKNVKSLESIFLRDCANISFEGVESIDSVSFLYVGEISMCDLSYISELKYMNRLNLWSFDFEENKFNSLNNIETLKDIGLHSLSNVNNFAFTFPKLKKIENGLYIWNNEKLANLDFLNDIQIPREFYTINTLPGLDNNYIVISDNENLEYCNNSFICKALETYPDSVRIENNGFSCNGSNLLLQCQSGIDNFSKNKITISPNPTRGIINIKGTNGKSTVTVRNLDNKVVCHREIVEDQVDFEHLASGLYIIEIENQGEIKIHKLVKVE